MENKDEITEQQPGLENQLPGKLLWETRTKRNLTLEQVADDLCLTPQQVEAMEKDDYSYLPGATYVRGYLRNYARLLGLSADKVLSIESIPTTVKSTKPRYRKAVVAEESTRSKSVALLSFIIVAILLGLIYSWWQSRETAEFAPFATENEAHETDTGAVADTATHMPEEASSEGSGTADVDEAATPSNDDVIPLDKAEAAEAAEKATEAGSEQPAATASAAPSVSSADGSDLVLVFTADSWLDIKDASGNSLIRRTVPAGETKSFKGTPPFKVFLGNAKGVKINYRGQNYDISPHINGAIARFVLK